MSDQRINKSWIGKIKKFFASISAGILFSLCYAESASAQGVQITGSSIGEIATNITGSFEGLARLITAAAYIAGIGFAMSAILKFKQHKDNPQQVTIGTPIALLFIAAALIFLPTIFGIAGTTIFGSSGTAGGISGVTS